MVFKGTYQFVQIPIKYLHLFVEGLILQIDQCVQSKLKVLLDPEVKPLDIRYDLLSDDETIRIQTPLKLEGFGGQSRQQILRVALKGVIIAAYAFDEAHFSGKDVLEVLEKDCQEVIYLDFQVKLDHFNYILAFWELLIY